MSPAQSVSDDVKSIPAFQPRRCERARRAPACLEAYDLCCTFEHWLELAFSLLYQFLLLFLFLLILKGGGMTNHLVSGTSCNHIFVEWESIARALKFRCFIETKAVIYSLQSQQTRSILDNVAVREANNCFFFCSLRVRYRVHNQA